MKVQELRIGNLVYGVSDRVEQITLISETKIITDLVKINAPMEVDLTDISPIPLTEEWLIKFGFVKEPLAYSINIDKFGRGKKITISSDYLYIVDSEKQNTIPTDIITIWNKDIVKEFYVHQLQNLYFTLTGEELKLK